MTERKVTTIPATVGRYSTVPTFKQTKRRVAAYGRVSTDSEEQLTSYEAQINYYTDYIKNHENWEFAGMYTDEGISGVTTKNRDGFNRMVNDALLGNIDLIISKSVSRFARNTVDSLTTIRKLKEHGVECYFEKENIWTFDGKGELLITIMSSLAQEESRSISENVKWGQRRRMAAGKVAVPFSTFLGYDKGPNGEMIVNEKEAEIVKLVYSLFIQGFSYNAIAKQLTEKGIPTPTGKNKWSERTIGGMLSNEKYKGDALMQKKYTADFLSKKLVVNNGELPQYYVEGDHEPIIPADTFDMVQYEIKRRKEQNPRYSGINIFSSRIICGECGAYYGAKLWHSNSKYRRVVYRCNQKYDEGKVCSTPSVTEEEIKKWFVSAMNKLLNRKPEIITNLESMQKELFSITDIEHEIEEVESEMELLEGMLQSSISENARVPQDQENYQDRFKALSEKYEKAKSKKERLQKQISDNTGRQAAARVFIDTLQKQPGIITEFDPILWGTLVDHMTVYSKENVRFTFKDKTEIQA